MAAAQQQTIAVRLLPIDNRLLTCEGCQVASGMLLPYVCSHCGRRFCSQCVDDTPASLAAVGMFACIADDGDCTHAKQLKSCSCDRGSCQRCRTAALRCAYAFGELRNRQPALALPECRYCTTERERRLMSHVDRDLIEFVLYAIKRAASSGDGDDGDNISPDAKRRRVRAARKITVDYRIARARGGFDATLPSEVTGTVAHPIEEMLHVVGDVAATKLNGE